MLLEADDLRIDTGGVPVVEGLALRVRGPRALVLGAPRALLEAAAGELPVVRGRLEVGGAPAGAAGQGVALVALDPPMPPRWTPREYVAWSARLGGASANEAEARAKAALERVMLGEVSGTRLDRSPIPARRATALAAALAAGAHTFLLEDPLARLAEDVAATFARILVESLADHAWVVFAPRVALGSPLAVAAEEAVLLAGSRVEAQGPPADLARAARRWAARVSAGGEHLAALAARVAERGGRLEAAPGGRVEVELGTALSTADLLGLAVEAEVVFLELLPVSTGA